MCVLFSTLQIKNDDEFLIALVVHDGDREDDGCADDGGWCVAVNGDDNVGSTSGVNIVIACYRNL